MYLAFKPDVPHFYDSSIYGEKRPFGDKDILCYNKLLGSN